VPKVIVPIVGRTLDSIIDAAKEFKSMRIDAVEWRADFYDDVFDVQKTVETARVLRALLPDKPVLFTFRTDFEGGEKAISSEEYANLNIAAARCGAVDMIDVEAFSQPGAEKLIEELHKSGVYVVASYHDFSATPGRDELVLRMRKMQDMGADIVKIAVMPSCIEDVLTLLAATSEMYQKYAKRPLVTVSMSSLGVISRVAGEAFGSSMTFGTCGQASAPGQIPADKLSRVLEILHETINNKREGETGRK